MAGQNRNEKIAMSDPNLRTAARAIFGYALSVLLVALSTGATLLLQDYTFRTPLFLPAILLSTWFGGTGPGLLAVLLSTLSINFFILEPRFAFAFSFRDAVHLFVFLFSALLISSWSAGRRRVEHALKKASADLEDKVAERTADLTRSNEQLRLHIAERERSVSALREKASLLNLTHDTVFVRDMNDVITYWNRGAQERYGWSSEEAEERLRRSQAFLAEGQRISRTGSWSWNVSKGEVSWSQEHFRIFGFDPKKTEPSFQLFLGTVHPEDRSFIERSLDEAVREKRGFDMEFRIALADGTVKHVQGVGRPAVDESGEVDRYIGTTVDITERKRGEALFIGEK